MAEPPLLAVDGLGAAYGRVQALGDVTIAVGAGEIVALLGANGAGKTTTLRVICGLLRPTSGSVRIGGRDVTALRTEDIVRLGVALVPEGRRVFAGMTVLENLEVGATSWGGTLRRMGPELDRVFGLFPRLAERRRQLAWSLSGGEQQMLAIGRALVARPRLLLLDEPSLGLAPLVVRTVFDTIGAINRTGTAILLVEQNAVMALGIAHRGYVLETGVTVLADRSDRLLHDERVRQAYLGA